MYLGRGWWWCGREVWIWRGYGNPVPVHPVHPVHSCMPSTLLVRRRLRRHRLLPPARPGGDGSISAGMVREEQSRDCSNTYIHIFTYPSPRHSHSTTSPSPESWLDRACTSHPLPSPSWNKRFSSSQTIAQISETV
jgi:hypothetical protein